MSIIILKRFCDTYFKMSCFKYQFFPNGKKKMNISIENLPETEERDIVQFFKKHLVFI